MNIYIVVYEDKEGLMDGKEIHCAYADRDDARVEVEFMNSQEDGRFIFSYEECDLY